MSDAAEGLKVSAKYGEVVLSWFEGGVRVFDWPMIPDEAKQLVNDLGAAIKFVAVEEALYER